MPCLILLAFIAIMTMSLTWQTGTLWRVREDKHLSGVSWARYDVRSSYPWRTRLDEVEAKYINPQTIFLDSSE